MIPIPLTGYKVTQPPTPPVMSNPVGKVVYIFYIIAFRFYMNYNTS